MKVDLYFSFRSPYSYLILPRIVKLRDKYGSVFNALMGAEAVLEVLKNIDLDSLLIPQEAKLKYQNYA